MIPSRYTTPPSTRKFPKHAHIGTPSSLASWCLFLILLNALHGVAGKKRTPCKSLHGAAALNGRLPPEDGSDRPQTSGKRVSGDPRHFIFRRHKHFLRPKFLLQKSFRQRSKKFFSKVPVLEELCRFTHQCRMQLENSLPELSVSAFYDPWRRGKKG